MAIDLDADNKLDFAILQETFDVSIASTLTNTVSCFSCGSIVLCTSQIFLFFCIGLPFIHIQKKRK
jgi:hypothetical protein